MAGWTQTIIVGNVGQPPELKYMQDGTAVCNFSVAVNTRKGRGDSAQDMTTWFRCAAWRELAEIVGKHVTKGQQVMVVGTVSARAYTDRQGQPAVSLDLTAHSVQFLGSRADNGAEQPDDVGNIPF